MFPNRSQIKTAPSNTSFAVSLLRAIKWVCWKFAGASKLYRYCTFFGLETIARDAGRRFDLCFTRRCGDVKWPKYFQTFLAPATIICLLGYLSNISLNLWTTFKTKNPWRFKKRKNLILCSKKIWYYVPVFWLNPSLLFNIQSINRQVTFKSLFIIVSHFKVKTKSGHGTRYTT